MLINKLWNSRLLSNCWFGVIYTLILLLSADTGQEWEWPWSPVSGGWGMWRSQFAGFHLASFLHLTPISSHNVALPLISCKKRQDRCIWPTSREKVTECACILPRKTKEGRGGMEEDGINRKRKNRNIYNLSETRMSYIYQSSQWNAPLNFFKPEKWWSYQCLGISSTFCFMLTMLIMSWK